MGKLAYLAVLGMLALPAVAAGETYKGVPLVDVNCSKKVAGPGLAHPTLRAEVRGQRIRRDHQRQAVPKI